MKSDAGYRITTLALLASPLASAFRISDALSSLVPRGPKGKEKAARADANSTTIPAALAIAPSQYWEGDDGPWSSFALQVGTAAQNTRAMISTAATYVVTIGSAGCPAFYPSDCDDTRGGLFLPNESLTWVPNSIYQLGIEDNLGLDTTATVGFDTVTFGWQGSGAPTVEHTVTYNMASPNYWVGLFGLNPRPTNFTNFRDPQTSFLQALVDNNTIPSLTYGYTAGNQYRLDSKGIFGSLVLGGYDKNRIDSTSNISVPLYTDISRDLLVSLQAITTDAGSPSNLLPDGSIQIFIDSTIAQLWLPESACTAFEQAFGLTYDNTSTFYLVNSTLHTTLLAQNANVTFTLGAQSSGGSTVDITLPYGAFDLSVDFPNVMNPNTSMYFPLKRATNSTQYTLGRTFLQEAYLIADYDRQNFTIAPCLWDADLIDTSSIKTILRANETGSGNSSNSSTPVGAIAGGVVGGVVGLIAMAGLIIFLLRRRKQAEKQRLAELDANNAGNGKDKVSHETNSEGKPFISAPIGGELGGGEIHELNALYKQHPQELESQHQLDPNKHGYSEMEGGEHFGPYGKHGAAEMHGSTPVFEMAGSDVHEMPASNERGTDEKKP